MNFKQDPYVVRADATGGSGCQEADLTTGVTSITPLTATVTVQVTDVSLQEVTLTPSVATPAVQSTILCSDAMAWRLYLPLVLR